MLAIIVLIGVVVANNYNDLLVVCVSIILFLAIVFIVIEPFIKRGEYNKVAERSILLLSVIFIVIFFSKREINLYDKHLFSIENETNGTVIGQLYKKEFNNNKYRYYLKDCEFSQSNKTGKCENVLVYVETDNFSIGDILKVNGQINKFSESENEGMFDEKEYYRCQKIIFSMRNTCVSLCKKSKFSIKEYLYQVRMAIVKSLANITSEDNLGVLSSMLVGERSFMDSDIKSMYQKSGIGHILAISGMHISIVGLSLYKLLRRMKNSFLISALVAMTTVFLYYQMTGGAISTKRAVIMLFLSLGASVFGRVNDMLNSLGVAVIIIIMDNPLIINYSGFVFSGSAIVAVALSEKVISTNRKSAKNFFVEEKLRQALFVWLFMLPVIAYFYYEIPMYSFLINIIIAPFLGAIFGLGFVAAIVGMLSIELASILIFPVNIILMIYKQVCVFTSMLPFSSIIVGRPWWLVVFMFYIVLLLLLFWNRNRSKFIKICMIVILFELLLLPKTENFEVDILSVGQGDGIYIASGKDNIFIDGGSTTVKEVAKYRILPFLKNNGISKIDYWFVSHGDEDHISGLKELIISDFEIKNIVVSKNSVKSKDKAVTELIELAKKYSVGVLYMNVGDYVKSGKTKIECIFPEEGRVDDDRNNICLSLMVSRPGFCGVFAGDIPVAEEKNLVNYLQKKYKSNKIGIDLYKVNHHGSKYSSGDEWLEFMNPNVSVISCGKGNYFGHPHKEAIQRLAKWNSKCYITKDSGQIKITVLGDEVKVIPYITIKE